MRHFIIFMLLAVFASKSFGASPQKTNAKIVVKTLIVTFFQHERDALATQLSLNKEIKFPQGYMPILTDGNGTFLLTTGVGNSMAASSFMALGMDSRFDFSKAYIILSGIAGGDPEKISLGSVVIQDYIVSGDLKYYIDEREKPSKWGHGYFPIGKSVPYQKPVIEGGKYNTHYKLNSKLVKWAYSTVKDVQLTKESQKLLARKNLFKQYPNAQKKPMVAIGSGLDTETFWHGKKMNDWAVKWVDYYTKGDGKFTTSAMEGVGIMQSATFLHKAKILNKNRIISLRSISNFTQQSEDQTAYESLFDATNGYSGFIDSLKNLAIVAESINKNIHSNWDTMKNKYWFC